MVSIHSLCAKGWGNGNVPTVSSIPSRPFAQRLFLLRGTVAKRKSISARTRFEIFKRDKFTCQYCGATPPIAVLHVDHIVPVVSGGTNDNINLISACQDCNLGKSSKPLDSIPDSLKDQIQEQQERRAQVAAYNKFLMKSRREDDEVIQEIGVYWCDAIYGEPGVWAFAPRRQSTIRTFLKSLMQADIIDAMDRAIRRVPPNDTNDDATFKYFCGICWGIIKGKYK